MQDNVRQLIGIALFAVVIGGVYYAFTAVDFFSSARRSAAEVDAQTAEIERELLTHLESLKDITLSDALFTSSEYKALVDASVPLVKPPVSRPDPFASY